MASIGLGIQLFPMSENFKNQTAELRENHSLY